MPVLLIQDVYPLPRIPRHAALGRTFPSINISLTRPLIQFLSDCLSPEDLISVDFFPFVAPLWSLCRFQNRPLVSLVFGFRCRL